MVQRLQRDSLLGVLAFLVWMLAGESKFVLTAVLVPCFAIAPEVMRDTLGSSHLESQLPHLQVQ